MRINRVNSKEIYKVASDVRKAIEDNHLENLNDFFASFRRFPTGCCKISSYLLAKRFFDLGFGNFDYVWGFRGAISHGWLQKGDLLIDISADQFKDMHKEIIVTRDHSWHSLFKNGKRHSANIENCDSYLSKMITLAYLFVFIKPKTPCDGSLPFQPPV